MATDLLIGIGIGICVKVLLRVLNGAPFGSLFQANIVVEQARGKAVRIFVKESAAFTTWIVLKKTTESLKGEHEVVVDLSGTYLVDHTVMEKLHEMENEFAERNAKFLVTGLDQHQKVSDHPWAARKRAKICEGTETSAQCYREVVSKSC